MNILLVNTFSFGGAAQSCIRLHRGLLDFNPAGKLLIQYAKGNLPPNTYLYTKPSPGFAQKMKDKALRIFSEFKLAPPTPYHKEKDFIQKRQPDLEMFSFPFADTDITQNLHYQQADIVNLHWVSGFLDYESFFKKNHKPIVWTLHDMNAFLGGEHYKERFLGVNEVGYPIPRQISPEESYWHNKIIAEKKKILAPVKNMHIVSPSQWLTKTSQNSEILGHFPHHTIPYGIPLDIFRPHPQHFCRDLLGLPKDKIVLLFVAVSVNSARKGFIFLKKAIEQIQNPDIHICILGANSGLSYPSKNKTELGQVQDELLMSVAYSAADLFIIPSLEDNLPNTVLESLGCGTPVVGFPTGGIVDMIQDGKNGYLCPEISVDSLKETINKFMLNPFAFDRAKIREDALSKYDLKIQAQAYLKLYQDILQNKIS